MKAKKILIIIAGVLVVILVALSIYLIFKKTGAKVAAQKIPATNVNNLKAQDPAFSPDGSTLYYYDLYKMDLFSLNLQTNQSQQLSDKMDQPLKVIWSPDRSQAIIKIIYDKHQFENFGSPFANPNLADNTTTLWHYNLKTKKYTLLSNKIDNPAALDPQNPVWTADSKQIIYHYADPANSVSTLNVANPDGSNWQVVGDVPADLYSILWYGKDSAQLFYTELDIESGLENIVSLNIETGERTDLAGGVGSIFPLDGTQVAYTQENQSFLYKFADNTKKTLPIKLLDTRVGLSDNGQTLLAATFANKYSYISLIDANTAKVTKKIDPNIKNEDVTHLIFSSDQKTLAFIVDTKLYLVSLK